MIPVADGIRASDANCGVAGIEAASLIGDTGDPS